jgi:DNA-binding beta-propeller fold protein YncE
MTSVKFDPSEICVSSAGNMYSISAGKDVIYSISADGQQRVFYSSPNLSYPVGIAADDNNVYVAGCGSNNVPFTNIIQ